MGPMHNVYSRIANFVNLVKMRTNCCCATVAIVAITRIASSRAWRKFPKVIGEFDASEATLLKKRRGSNLLNDSIFI
jgi:hypothetical protein